MDDMRDTGVVVGSAPGRAGHLHRLRWLAVTGFIATLVAVAATTLAAALARAVGVDFEVASVFRLNRVAQSGHRIP